MSEALLGAWLQVYAVIATAAFAGIIAFWGILSQRAISRRTATVTYIATVDADRDLIDARKIFITEAQKPEGLTPWAERGKEYAPECAAIRLVLNELELASIGIQLGTLDDELFRRYNRGTVIKYWYAAAPFIYSVRLQVGRKEVYHEFEELYRRYEADRPPPRKWRFLKLR